MGSRSQKSQFVFEIGAKRIGSRTGVSLRVGGERRLIKTVHTKEYLVIASPEMPALQTMHYVRLWYCCTARLLSCWVHVGHHPSDLREILPIRSLRVGCWRVCEEKTKDES